MKLLQIKIGIMLSTLTRNHVISPDEVSCCLHWRGITLSLLTEQLILWFIYLTLL